jgi:PhnB protein
MIALNPARPGYSTVSPYLIVENPEKQLEFINIVFGPEITEPVKINPDGRAELKIGNTSLIVIKTYEARPVRTSTLYIYVKNINETYVKAMGANAEALFEPVERYNDDLECGFEDISGNLWICAKFDKQLSHDEMMEPLKNLGITSS